MQRHTNSQTRHGLNRAGVTMLELLVAVIIVGILATISVGVYTGQIRRARIAATKDLIRQLEIAIARYEVDLGVLPPSGSSYIFDPIGPVLPITEDNIEDRWSGSGLLHVALVHSMTGNVLRPASPLWQGPYITFQAEQLSEESAFASPSEINILDSWGNPVLYVESRDYEFSSTRIDIIDDNDGDGLLDFWGGTRMFSDLEDEPFGPGLPYVDIPTADPDLPNPNPFALRGETFYNASTFQIVSLGPDGQTTFFPARAGQPYPELPDELLHYHGTRSDDVTNFGF